MGVADFQYNFVANRSQTWPLARTLQIPARLGAKVSLVTVHRVRAEESSGGEEAEQLPRSVPSLTGPLLPGGLLFVSWCHHGVCLSKNSFRKGKNSSDGGLYSLAMLEIDISFNDSISFSYFY